LRASHREGDVQQRALDEDAMAEHERRESERGILSTIGILIGGGCLLVAAVSVINTAFDLDLALGVSGSSTPLPNNWESVIGLAIGGLMIVALSLFGGFVAEKFVEAKGKPLHRVGILALAFGFLALAFRGIQILVLVNVYGSMLAYYSTDGDLEDVTSELAKGPDREALDKAVSRAAQYDNHEALGLLLEAGADMMDETRPPEWRTCALVGESYEFIKVSLDHGITPATCVNGEAAIWEAVRFSEDDAEAAKIVGLLRGAGWSTTALPEHQTQTAVELATEKEWTQTIALLGTPAG